MTDPQKDPTLGATTDEMLTNLREELAMERMNGDAIMAIRADLKEHYGVDATFFDDAVALAIAEASRRATRATVEECCKLVEDPPILAFGPGGSAGTRAALDKLTGDEFAGLLTDWAEFIVSAIREHFRAELEPR